MATIPSYYEGLLSEDDMSSLRTQALASGLLNAGAAFSRAGAPSLMPQGSGLSEALQGFQGGYQGQIDSALQNMLKATQVQELVRKQKEAQQLKQLYASAATPKYQTVPGVQTPISSDVGFEYPAVTQAPATQKLVGYDYDLAKIIPMLQASGNFAAIKDISDSMKSLRQSGLMNVGGAETPSPFAPYLTSASPEVRIQAKNYDAAFKSGRISEDVADKYTVPLATMQADYNRQQESRLDRLGARSDAAAERELKRAEGGKPTEAEQKAAGFAQRMELSNQLMSEIVDKTAKAQLASGGKNAKGETITDPYASTKTQIAGSIPIAGDYLRDYASSKQQMLYRQAQENWVRANLRKESGAVIGTSEMNDEIRTYFPGPLDPPELVAQKELARQVTQNAMKTAAGKSYAPFNMQQFKKDRGLE
jgi:hypothetical protein